MKNLRRLPFKIIIFILTVVTFVAFGASVSAGFYMLHMGLYDKTEEEILVDETRFYFYDLSYQIVNTYIITGKTDAYEAYNTNLRFTVTDKEGKFLFTNIDMPFDMPDNSIIHHDWQFETGYIKHTVENAGFCLFADNENGVDSDYRVYAYIDHSFPVKDLFYETHIFIGTLIPFMEPVIYIIGISLALFITFFVLLMCISARRADTDEIVPGKLHKVPFDLLLSVSGFTIWFLIYTFLRFTRSTDYFTITVFVLLIILAGCAIMGIFMSIAGRVKTKTLLSNNVIYKLIWLPVKLVKYIIPKIPLIWKIALITIGTIVLDIFINVLSSDYGAGFGIFLTLFKGMAVLVAVSYIAVVMTKLKESAEALASGDLSYKTDTSLMLLDFKKHGENLNSISEGMSKAVENKLKSERLRTELITNVSHDIKNPLTSIINYSSLLASEECECKNHKEYSEVLERKSEHLKRLLEDLIEMSKASTGNLSVDLVPLDAGVLLNQIFGEFEERCNTAGLTLIVKQPEESVMILADNRKIWRVFENLLGNACKYSLTGSRIYLNLEADNGTAVFSVRNTSSEPLNISPDELMERFVRADSSRSTEGNGLGLSIARSLTEIQGGAMDVSIDGDLFKVTLKFKTA